MEILYFSFTFSNQIDSPMSSLLWNSLAPPKSQERDDVDLPYYKKRCTPGKSLKCFSTKRKKNCSVLLHQESSIFNSLTKTWAGHHRHFQKPYSNVPVSLKGSWFQVWYDWLACSRTHHHGQYRETKCST